jgi:nucleoid DNA-binding protein
MNKADLINEVATRTGLTKRAASRGIKATLKIISNQVGSGNVIHIRGLGSLKLRPKRRSVLPVRENNSSAKLIETGKTVRLKPSRKAITEIRAEPGRLDNHEITIGGNLEMAKEKENETNESAAGADTALGLDVGTSRLVLAGGAIDKVQTESELNAFITVPYSKFTENILKQNKIHYYLNETASASSLQVFGNEAGRFANVFNIEVRRPMMGGTLNPDEEQSMSVIQAIIDQLLKKTGNGENLRFSVPGPGRDGSAAADLVYHEAMLKKLLDTKGYNSKGVNEGLAVVFAELEKENFSGIGISCGGGMCNVALAFMSIPVMTFSITKAGDYIDRSVASVTGEVATRIRIIKEESLDLARTPENKFESALHIYYDDVILSLVESLRNALAEAKNMPGTEKPVPIVLSGGTAMPKGFLEKFQQAIERDKFPLAISEIRMARDPLTGTARGCLIAALYDA